MDLDSDYSRADHSHGMSSTGSHSASENDSYDEEEYYLSYSPPDNIMPTIDLMAFFTSLLTVFGLFTNGIAMGMLSAQIFERMSFAVLMKILCIYNIVVLFLGTIRYHSFYLDYRTHILEIDRRNFCTCLLWFVLVFRHARTASIMLILYNRINALSSPDCFNKYADAVRLPILGNTLFLLVSTIPVSRYISALDARTREYNRTECTFAYMLPYKRDDKLSTDEMVSNLPVFEQCTIVFMLVYFFIKLIRNKRRKHNDGASESTTSTPPLPVQPINPYAQKYSVWKLRNQSSMGKFSVLPTQGVMEIKGILFPVSACHVEERDSAVIVMAVTVIIMNSVTCGLRELVDSFVVMDLFPITATDIMAFKIRSFLDLSYYTFMATMFFFMCLTCAYFRQSAFNLLYSINVADSHSESSLAYGSESRINMMPIESILHTDALERSLSERKFIDSPNQEIEDNLLTTGSVWSLDKTYFLNATTRQHAVIETF